MRLVNVVIKARSPRAITTSEALTQIVDLILRGHHGHHGVEKTGSGESPAQQPDRSVRTVRPRGGRHEDHLRNQFDELVEVQGAVVHGAGKAETM
jgi:hypothetical protein